MIACRPLRALTSLTGQRQLLQNLAALHGGSRQAYYSEDTSSKDVSTTVAPQQQKSSAPKGRIGLTDHRVNKLEKLLLVWGGKYKSLAEVPDLVSQEALERARNKARIKINIMMCIATLLGCLAMVYSGKKSRDAGESVVKMNLEWHKKVKEEAEAKTNADTP